MLSSCPRGMILIRKIYLIRVWFVIERRIQSIRISRSCLGYKPNRGYIYEEDVINLTK
jgi:hypothetical protein